MKPKGKIRWGVVLNAIVGVAAALSDPHVLALLPAKVSAALTVGSIVIAAVMKPAVRREHERRP